MTKCPVCDGTGLVKSVIDERKCGLGEGTHYACDCFLARMVRYEKLALAAERFLAIAKELGMRSPEFREIEEALAALKEPKP